MFDLTVNADVVDRRAGDTREFACRAVHARKGRVGAKQACDGRAAAAHDATVNAICNRTPVVVEASTRTTERVVRKGGKTPALGTIRKEKRVARASHGSLLRMQPPEPERSPESYRGKVRVSGKRQDAVGIG